MDHPLVAQFEAGAELLDLQRDRASIDDAVVRLAAWMDLAADHLTEDDQTVLVGIGAVLYRDGLRRRLAAGDR
ncbi:MAG: hypothetical protein HY020_07110 [Burkholderiales bacterium]|nr:hypothetical protein [Burkholderiales bacterium]